MSGTEQAAIFERLGIDPNDLPEDAPKADPQRVALLLRNIGGVLHQSESYRSLPEHERAAILQNTERIAAALSDSPDRLMADTSRSGPDGEARRASAHDHEAKHHAQHGGDHRCVAPLTPHQDPFALSV